MATDAEARHRTGRLLAAAAAVLCACPSSPGPLPPGGTWDAGLRAIPGDGAVVVSWKPGVGASALFVLRDTVGDGPGHRSTGVDVAGAAFFVDSNVENGETYVYRLEATTATGSVRSLEARATPAAGVTVCMTLEATDVKDTSLTVHGLVVNPPGNTAEVWFDVGPTAAYGSSTPAQGTTVAGVTRVSYTVTPVPQDSEHHHRVVVGGAPAPCTGADVAARTVQTPEVLATAPVGPLAPLLGADHVYWADVDGIARVAKSGGAREPVVVLAGVTALAGDDATVYASTATGGVHAVDVQGRASSALSGAYDGGSGPTLALAGGSLLWSDGEDGRIWTVPATGGTPSTLVDRRVTAFDVADGVLYWSEYLGTSLWRMPLVEGAIPTLLATGSGIAQYVFGGVVAGGWVYYADGTGIRRVPTSGGTSELFVATSATGAVPRRGAADATHLYWVDAGYLRKAPLAGGPAETLAYGTGPYVTAVQPGPLVVDDTHVYWIRLESGYPPSGSVVRTPKG
jgi:hypothetical protein